MSTLTRGSSHSNPNNLANNLASRATGFPTNLAIRSCGWKLVGPGPNQLAIGWAAQPNQLAIGWAMAGHWLANAPIMALLAPQNQNAIKMRGAHECNIRNICAKRPPIEIKNCSNSRSSRILQNLGGASPLPIVQCPRCGAESKCIFGKFIRITQ